MAIDVCVDHIHSLFSAIRNFLSDNESTFSAHIDMQKAFYWVNRDILYKSYGDFVGSGQLYNTAESIYCTSNASVKLNGRNAPYFGISFGVKQCDNLSPHLFHCIKMIRRLKSSPWIVALILMLTKLLIHADDMVLIAPYDILVPILKMISIHISICLHRGCRLDGWSSEWKRGSSLSESLATQIVPTKPIMLTIYLTSCF